jgi:hypothetical protein
MHIVGGCWFSCSWLVLYLYLLYCRFACYVVSLYIIVERGITPTGLSQLQITNLLLFLC